MADYDYLKRVHRELLDSGKVIEAGWVGLRLAAIPPDASAQQLESMREAFFAGAQHLFATIMVGLDDDAEPTLDDLKRMDNIDTELKTFIAVFEKKHGLAGREQ